jgi:hypothetical protein
MIEEAVEAGAQAIYENWANYPTCSNSKPWSEVCEKLPALANDFRRKSRACIEAVHNLEPTLGSDVRPWNPTEFLTTPKSIEAYREETASAERERCAKKCDELAELLLSTAERLGWYDAAKEPRYSEIELHEQVGTVVQGLAQEMRSPSLRAG